MATDASSHTLSPPTALCVFTSHNPFISLNLPFLVSFLFQLVCHSLFFSFYSLNSSYFHHIHYFNGFLFFSQNKRTNVLLAPLKERTPLVLLKTGLMRSLGALLYPYETPGTPLVCSFLRCPIVRPLHPLTPRYFLGKQVLLVPLKSQTLERFLIFRLGRDSERRFPSFSISSLGRSKAGPFGWIKSFLMRSL